MSIAILSGIALVVVTVVIHAQGTTHWARFLMHRYARHSGVFKEREALRVVTGTALVLLLLHVVEIVVWALAYLLLLPSGELQTVEKAVYFSLVTFTTVGYGDVALTALDWRLLSGIEALNGMLLLGWSTALLYAIVHRTLAGYEGGAAR